MSRFETARQRLTGAADTLRQKASETRDVAQVKFDSAAGTAREQVLQTAPEPVKRVAGQARERASDLWAKIPSRSANKGDRNAGAQALSEHEKRSLCRELVTLAVVDGNLHPHEISSLYLLFTTMDLNPDTRKEVRNLLASVQHVGAEHWDAAIDEQLAQALLDDADEDHRTTVAMVMIRLMVELARADGPTVPVERDRITAIAAHAFPETAVQVVATTERLVANEAAFLAGKISKNQFESTAKDAAAKAAAFGVPIVAVSAVGFTGLSAAGITSGLATLGFGGILGLSSMVTGIGTVVAVGVVVHQGVRYVLGTNERGREKKREHLMQQVLLNHQRAIEDLTADISGLARRMEEQLTLSTANEDQLAALRADLTAFQAALSQLHSSKESVELQAAEA